MGVTRYIWNKENNEVMEFKNSSWLLDIFGLDAEALEDPDLFVVFMSEECHPVDLEEDEEYFRWLYARIIEFIGGAPLDQFKTLSEWDWELDHPEEKSPMPRGMKGLYEGRYFHNGELALRIPFKLTASAWARDYEEVDGRFVYIGG